MWPGVFWWQGGDAMRSVWDRQCLYSVLVCLVVMVLRCAQSSAQVPVGMGTAVPTQGVELSTGSLVPGVSIVLYVSSLDKTHFESVVKRALYVRDTDPRVRLSAVFHLGDYRNISPEMEEAFRKRAIYFAAIPALPKALAAASSPTWVIRTPQTDHIVEGPVPIEDCFDSHGAYQEPKPSQATKVPSPTPGVKEF